MARCTTLTTSSGFFAHALGVTVLLVALGVVLWLPLMGLVAVLWLLSRGST